MSCLRGKSKRDQADQSRISRVTSGEKDFSGERGVAMEKKTEKESKELGESGKPEGEYIHASYPESR